MSMLFFFQAEDGIRDGHVTGVQTCALPISGSMKPTILEGDRVFVNKLAYDLKVPFTTLHLADWANPHRGDIVVFYSPHDEARLVKRVIGLPGDVIELWNDQLVINGIPLVYA